MAAPDNFGITENGGLYGHSDYTAIVTVKKSPTDTVFFQVDDTTRIFPRNAQNIYTRVERIICGVSIYNKRVPGYGWLGDVLWAEALDEGMVTADATVKGDDGLDIIFDWMTGCEDGFLTLHYSTMWGARPVRHRFYIVTGANGDNPYEVELRQDSAGDSKDDEGDSVVYFDINTLPDTGDEYKTLTLKWKSSSGQTAEHEFKYKTRK